MGELKIESNVSRLLSADVDINFDFAFSAQVTHQTPIDITLKRFPKCGNYYY